MVRERENGINADLDMIKKSKKVSNQIEKLCQVRSETEKLINTLLQDLTHFRLCIQSHGVAL